MILLILLTIAGYAYWVGDENTKLGVLLGGLVATLIAVIIQFILSLHGHMEMDRLRRMGFQNVLTHRKDRQEYYAELLAHARKEIDFLGNTAWRFLNDFAFEGEGGSDMDRLLLAALERNIQVRILVAPTAHLPPGKKADHKKSMDRLQELKQRFPRYLDYRELSHVPTQTYVRVDRACVFGPVFPGIPSRVTPAIHAETSSPFLDQYFTYFDRGWDYTEDGR